MWHCDQPQAVSVEAVITRCGCGEPAQRHPGAACPQPRRVERLGVVALWHRNPLRRVGFVIKQMIRGRRVGRVNFKG